MRSLPQPNPFPSPPPTPEEQPAWAWASAWEPFLPSRWRTISHPRPCPRLRPRRPPWTHSLPRSVLTAVSRFHLARRFAHPADNTNDLPELRRAHAPVARRHEVRLLPHHLLPRKR